MEMTTYTRGGCMGLSIYMGRAGAGKTYACYEKIKDIIDTCPGEPIILLVPEPATYQVERELAEHMPQGGFTTVRVVGFRRLAYQVFQSIGKVRSNSISKVGRNLLLRLIMKREGSSLDILQQAAKQPHFSDVLQNVFSECRAFKVSSQELVTGAHQIESTNILLSRKLRELAKIMESYEAALAVQGQVDVDPIEELIGLLDDTPLLKQAHIVVDGFHWFTPVQYELLYNLFDRAKEAMITITLPTNPKEREKYRQKGTLFNRPWEVFDTLCQRYGTDVTIRNFTKTYRYTSPILASLEADFLQSPAKNNTSHETIEVVEGYHREREVDAVCRKIVSYIHGDDEITDDIEANRSTRKHVENASMNRNRASRRWRDMMIILRESETYGDILEKTLSRYEIPYFIDRQHPMDTHPVSELLLAVLEVVEYPFNHDAMFRMLKTDLFPLSREAVDELENYCLEFGIREHMWQRDRWQYTRQSNGHNEEMVAQEEARLERVNMHRQYIMDILEPWYQFANASHTGREWGEQFYQLLVHMDIPDQLRQWCQLAQAEGDTKTVAAHEQMYKRVMDMIDEIMLLATDDILSLDEMALLMQEGLRDVNYSIVPPTLDHVVITTVERGYNLSRPIVFVMGLNEGVFPQRMGDEGLLRDADRQELEQIGITLAAGALGKTYHENFLFYLACTRASEHVYLSLAATDEEGVGLERSLSIDRLMKKGFVQTILSAPLAIDDGHIENYIWRIPQSISLLSAQFGNLLKGCEIAPIWWGLYEWLRTSSQRPLLAQAVRGLMDSNTVPLIHGDVVRALFLKEHAGHQDMIGSVTRLEKYQTCPFKFYAEYGLRLQERPIKSFGAPEIGTFLHECLRMLGMELLAQQQQWRDMSDEEQAEICEKIVENIANTPAFQRDESDAYQNNLQIRLLKTLQKTVQRLCDWSRKSRFNTKYLEQSFGSNYQSWKPLYIDVSEHTSIRLEGQIDRIDEYNDGHTTYRMIIDYKTGGASVSASDIYYGLKLQLVTYLLALEQLEKGHSMIPAAVLYTYVRNPRLSKPFLTEKEAKKVAKDDTSLHNTGYFIHDLDVLDTIDDTYRLTPSSYVPVKLTAKGNVYSTSLSKLKTVSEFHTLTNYASRMMASIGTHITKGIFPISPYQLDKKIPCSYCEYRSLCRFDGTRNSYRYIHKKQEQEALEAMKKGDELYEVD